MTLSFTGRKRLRKFFGKIQEIADYRAIGPATRMAKRFAAG